MKIFAYGSNMSLERLKKRISSATFYKIGKITGHLIKFHKTSKDGSGKTDCFKTSNIEDELWGVIFDIDPSQKENLDKFEGKGKGYEEKLIDVLCDEGYIKTYIYYATNITESLKPYDWYINHVIIGAKQFNLPEQYIKILVQQEYIIDPDEERRKLEFSLYS
jgi:gamma-glutamylcyclotransferase (GGCT)/AIG2-like uncharacterized protein YtfP